MPRTYVVQHSATISPVERSLPLSLITGVYAEGLDCYIHIETLASILKFCVIFLTYIGVVQLHRFDWQSFPLLLELVGRFELVGSTDHPLARMSINQTGVMHCYVRKPTSVTHITFTASGRGRSRSRVVGARRVTVRAFLGLQPDDSEAMREDKLQEIWP
jgi:hypothetical protein